MSAGMTAVIGLQYLAIAGTLFLEGKYPASLTFFAYALGNVGFCWAFWSNRL